MSLFISSLVVFNPFYHKGWFILEFFLPMFSLSMLKFFDTTIFNFSCLPPTTCDYSGDHHCSWFWFAFLFISWQISCMEMAINGSFHFGPWLDCFWWLMSWLWLSTTAEWMCCTPSSPFQPWPFHSQWMPSQRQHQELHLKPQTHSHQWVAHPTN